ncbi:RlmE family RNA methyltransferase [Candidatus Blochmannia ocreatus (nom. nud.)]|uniref:Ribosomal RNA large subunit methyltransferase E n=1 Tax=Candidatus Blochmannia ocreatus (nom. nud.) TaxID=251538 RepID=A0ABY4SYZ5_9ENTR|nr:SAM-dependent methyltransferase [Candidatus Blochmannia ocreatus]URJ25182.1 23S rRNA (uridine(2552)-2'-O)-methyltransferase [Candidatus Blochmannia ocreatus]
MTNKKNSKKWIKKHFTDQYVKSAKIHNLRARSWFKLQAINYTDNLFTTGMRVVDLGSAPGGWALYAKKKIGNTGKIIACDILPMPKICGVDFLNGDCSDPKILEGINIWSKNRKVHIILSDMSPNITGISIIDINKSIYLGNLALKICQDFLKYGGTFVVKVFQGKNLDKYLHDVSSVFNIVKIRKPYSSNPASREIYIVAKKHKKV